MGRRADCEKPDTPRAPGPRGRHGGGICLASAAINFRKLVMRAQIAFSLACLTLATAAVAEESGPPSPPGPTYLPAAVSLSGSAFTYPNGNVVQGGINDGSVYTFGAGAGTPYAGGIVSWGNSGSLAQLQLTLTPDASAFASTTQSTAGRSSAGSALGYRVLLVANDSKAAADIAARIDNGDALANVSGHWNLGATGYGYSSVQAVTSANVPNANLQTAAYHQCGSYGHLADASTPGCGGGSFSLAMHFVSTADMVGGNALSFVSSVSLYANADSGIANGLLTYPGSATAFIDPTITLVSGLNAHLIVGDNGSVANPVPEPSTWALMVGGLVGLLAWRRRAAR